MAAEWTKTGLSAREQTIVEAVLIATADTMRPLVARIAALEGAQHRTLADTYRGGYMPNTDYRRGDVIADRNSLWVCMDDTEERPGSTTAWKLIMKAPR